MKPKFTTLTAEDWRRSIKRSRETPNAVLESIRAAKEKIKATRPCRASI